MAKGVNCHCPERKKPIRERSWYVLIYKGNYSAFNGYKFTRSDHSEILCKKCSAIWRTDAAYVEKLQHELFPVVIDQK